MNMENPTLCWGLEILFPHHTCRSRAGEADLGLRSGYDVGCLEPSFPSVDGATHSTLTRLPEVRMKQVYWLVTATECMQLSVIDTPLSFIYKISRCNISVP